MRLSCIVYSLPNAGTDNKIKHQPMKEELTQILNALSEPLKPEPKEKHPAAILHEVDMALYNYHQALKNGNTKGDTSAS